MVTVLATPPWIALQPKALSKSSAALHLHLPDLAMPVGAPVAAFASLPGALY